MMKEKKPSVGKKVLLVFGLFWFTTAILALFIIEWQYGRLQDKQGTIRELANEIRWQRYAADKAIVKVVATPELEYLASVMETRDRDLFAVAKAAWKWGKVYQVSPYLIMAVAHRESNFNPLARSLDIYGQQLAHGVMQINFRVWQKELNLDPARIDDIDYNVQQGVIILKHYLVRNPGDISRGLWEYWGRGEVNIYSPRVLESKYFDGTEK